MPRCRSTSRSSIRARRSSKKTLLRTNPGGVIAFDHELPGVRRYRPLARRAGGRRQAARRRYDLQVEEFVPERMKVAVTPKKAGRARRRQGRVRRRGAVPVRRQRGRLRRRADVHDRARPRSRRRENADLTYGVEPKGKPVTLGEARDQLDPKGKLDDRVSRARRATRVHADRRADRERRGARGRQRPRDGEDRDDDAAPREVLHRPAKTKATSAQAGKTVHRRGHGRRLERQARTGGGRRQLDVELLHLEADYGYGYDDDSGESRYDR